MTAAILHSVDRPRPRCRPRPRRPPRAHARLGRRERRRGDPGLRPRADPARRDRHRRPRTGRRGARGPGDRPGARPPARGRHRRGGDHPRRPPARPLHRGGRCPRCARCANRSASSTSRVAWPSRPTRSSPIPLCAQAWTLRALLDAKDPRVRPDALEAFNPTTFGRPVHRRVVAFAAEHGLAVVGNSDAHEAAAVGTGWTTFRGRTAEDLRAAILAGESGWHGSFHRTSSQLPTFGRQLRKYSRDVAGRDRGPGPPRRLGPGPRLPGRRPAAAEAGWVGHRPAGETRGGREDRPGDAVRLPAPGRRQRPRRPPLREPPRPRPRRPDPDRQPRPAAQLGGRRHPDRQGLLRAGQRLRRHPDGLASLSVPDPGRARSRAVRPAPLPRALRPVPDPDDPARIPERERRHVPRLRRLRPGLPDRRPDARPGRRQPAPRAHRRQRRRPPLRGPLPAGRLQGDPERRGPPPLRPRRPAGPLAGWPAEHPLRGAPGAAQGPPAPPQGVPDGPPDGQRLPASWSSAPGRSSARRGATS